MARQWRVQFEGAVYHIMSRGVGRGKIFLDEKDYAQFLEYIEKAAEKFNLEIFSFVLMSNHYHLLLRINKPNLSKAVQWIKTSYAVYFNRRYHRFGHLFQDRYKSILVGEEPYWYRLSVYIHLNPVRAGIVNNPQDYKWSSYHDYVDMQKSHLWVKSEKLLEGFGNTRQEKINRYMELTMQVSGQERNILAELKHGLILGSETFVDLIQKKFTTQKENLHDELKDYRSISERGIKEKTFRVLMNKFNISKEEIISSRRHKSNCARDTGIYILHMHTNFSNAEIGRLFGISLSNRKRWGV